MSLFIIQTIFCIADFVDLGRLTELSTYVD